ncbi:MAG: TRAP transporter small permease [Burkholderiaceae bacterium]
MIGTGPALAEHRPAPGATDTWAGRWLERLARLLAWAGGMMMTAITLMSVYSVVMRNLVGRPIQGDLELVQMGCAISIAAFLPLCQLRNGHIIVDFFTSRATDATRHRLDALGSVLIGLVMALLAWRTLVGAIEAYANLETTMIMGLPLWVGYGLMVPSLAVAAWAAFWLGVRRVKGYPDPVPVDAM